MDNTTNYFFTLLDPRFDLLNIYLKDILEKIYGKRFEPIYILSNKVTERFKKERWLLLNSQVKMFKDQEEPNVIFIPKHEDLNEDFSNSYFINEIIRKLSKKQDIIYINAFTTSFFNINADNILFIGPNPRIATYFDSKVIQRILLKNLNLPIPAGKIFNNFSVVETAVESKKVKGFFISAEYGSGGFEVAAIRKSIDLNKFKKRIRPKNLKNRFIVTEILDKVVAPNATALILDNKNVFVISISDQIEIGTTYIGNIYPSCVCSQMQEKMIEYTRAIGLNLAKEGYRGFFGCDFVVTPEDKCYVVDINPRKQGGLLCNLLMFERLKPSGFPNLIELEFKATSGKEVKGNFRAFENPTINYYWAHCKIPPKEKNVKIKKEVSIGLEEECFSRIDSYSIKSFFPKESLFVHGSSLGSIIMTGKAYDELLSNILKKMEDVSQDLLGDSTDGATFKNSTRSI